MKVLAPLYVVCLLSSIVIGQEGDRLDNDVSAAYLALPNDPVSATNALGSLKVTSERTPRELLFKKRPPPPTYSKKALSRPVYSKKASAASDFPVYSNKKRYLVDEDESPARELLLQKKRAYRPTYNKKAPVKPAYTNKAPVRPVHKKSPAVYEEALYSKKAQAPAYSKKVRYLGDEDESPARELVFKKKGAYRPTYSKTAYTKKAPVAAKMLPVSPVRPVHNKNPQASMYSKNGRYLGEDGVEESSFARELALKHGYNRYNGMYSGEKFSPHHKHQPHRIHRTSKYEP